MGNELPLLTMVKSKEINEVPDELTEQSIGLLSTLTTLCSFYSVEDFVSFIFSEKFIKIIDYDDPWVVFEIGLYLDHQKNLQFIASKDNYLFIDNTEVSWKGGSLISSDSKQIAKELSKWCEMTYNPNSRFE
tara:strand:- start:455 stop:850 length:396 start_codon:yes stop_codon:yes gene_type:complete